MTKRRYCKTVYRVTPAAISHVCLMFIVPCCFVHNGLGLHTHTPYSIGVWEVCVNTPYAVHMIKSPNNTFLRTCPIVRQHIIVVILKMSVSISFFTNGKEINWPNTFWIWPIFKWSLPWKVSKKHELWMQTVQISIWG